MSKAQDEIGVQVIKHMRQKLAEHFDVPIESIEFDTALSMLKIHLFGEDYTIMIK